MLKKSSVFVLFFLMFSFSRVSFPKVDTRVKWGGDYRFRFYFSDNLTFENSKKEDLSSHRFILKGEMAPNDDIETHFSININQVIGGEGKRGFSGLEGFNDDLKDIQILTAYADWHLGSSFFLKLGRINLNWGNEAVVSSNLDDQRPYGFDGLFFGYDSESFMLNTGVLRVGDWSKDMGSPSAIDPEESAYFIILDFKSFGEIFRTAEFFFLRLESSEFIHRENSVSIGGYSLNRFGFSLVGSKSKVFYQADYVNLLGSYSKGGNAQAWMGHINLGVNFGEKQPASVYLIGHYDSGDDSTSTEVDESYRPIYYNHHKYAGFMDLLAWGNLTYYGLGASLFYKGQTEFKTQILRFSLTDTFKGPNSISYLGYGDSTSFISEDVSKNTKKNVNSNLGTELDFVITRKFLSEAYLELVAGTFIPDAYFKAYGRNEKLYSFRLSIGFKF